MWRKSKRTRCPLAPKIFGITLGVLVSAGLVWAQSEEMRAHFIDVGQGDATLLEFPCGAVLIDAGGQNAATTQALIDYLVEVLDGSPELPGILDSVIVTHTHIDHNEALRQIIEDERIAVERYVHNGILDGSGAPAARWMNENAAALDIETRVVLDSEITQLPQRRGLTDSVIDPIRCDPINPRIRILSGRVQENPGWPRGVFQDGNNHSLVVRVDFGESSFLFTGDLEEHALETLVEYYDGTRTLDVDVYQVGHHGSGNGSTESLMDAMTARIAVISMSRWSDRRSRTAWAYGHPRDRAVETVEVGLSRHRRAKQVHIASGVRQFFKTAMRSAIFATGWDGTVVIVARSDGRMVVRRER